MLLMYTYVVILSLVLPPSDWETLLVLVPWTVRMGCVLSDSGAGIICFAEYGSDGDFRWRHVANLY